MTDMSKLIERLRKWHNDTGAPSYRDAADALEAQAREIERLLNVEAQRDAAERVWRDEIAEHDKMRSRLAAAEQEQANRRIVAMGEMNDALLRERDELIGMREEVLYYQREFHRLRDERDEAVALLREAAPHVGRGPVTKELRRRIDAFLAADSATHRETPVT